MPLTLAQESWTWYGHVVVVVCFRFTSRIWHLGGLKGLGAEDWIMMLVVAFYTVLVVFMNIVAGVDTNLINPLDNVVLTPESVQARIYGSKMVLLVEQCMIMTQWGCKICLLLLYNKLTFGLKQQQAVKIVGGYVIICLIIMESCYFGVWCRPFHEYWAVPTDNIQCSAALRHLITNATFNISSDVMMLCIPLPLLVNSQLPNVKKAILCVLFGMGIFVILCAALNKYYSFAQPFSPIWTFWYIREASVAIMITNIPNCWPLLRRVFKFRSFNGSYDDTRSGAGVKLACRTGNTGSKNEKGIFSKTGTHSQKLGRDNETVVSRSRRDRDALSRTESQIELKDSNLEFRGNQESDIGDQPQSMEPLEIWRKDEVTVNGVIEEGGERHRAIMFGGALGGDAAAGFRTMTVVTAQQMVREERKNTGGRAAS